MCYIVFIHVYYHMLIMCYVVFIHVYYHMRSYGLFIYYHMLSYGLFLYCYMLSCVLFINYHMLSYASFIYYQYRWTFVTGFFQKKTLALFFFSSVCYYIWPSVKFYFKSTFGLYIVMIFKSSVRYNYCTPQWVS